MLMPYLQFNMKHKAWFQKLMLHLHYKYEAQALKLEAYAFISSID